jgi:hypothetical protein
MGDATDELFWAKRGEVACAAHAPALVEPRWQGDGWERLRAPGRRLLYRCQHCHATRLGRIARDAARSTAEPALSPKPTYWSPG